MKSSARLGSGGMSAVTSAGKSEKLQGRPNSLRFRTYSHLMSMVLAGDGGDGGAWGWGL